MRYGLSSFYEWWWGSDRQSIGRRPQHVTGLEPRSLSTLSVCLDFSASVCTCVHACVCERMHSYVHVFLFFWYSRLTLNALAPLTWHCLLDARYSAACANSHSSKVTLRVKLSLNKNIKQVWPTSILRTFGLAHSLQIALVPERLMRKTFRCLTGIYFHIELRK